MGSGVSRSQAWPGARSLGVAREFAEDLGEQELRAQGRPADMSLVAEALVSQIPGSVCVRTRTEAGAGVG